MSVETRIIKSAVRKEYMRNLRDGKTDDPIVQGVTPSMDVDALRVPAERIAELENENERLKAELAKATEVSGRYTKIALHQQERLLASSGPQCVNGGTRE